MRGRIVVLTCALALFAALGAHGGGPPDFPPTTDETFDAAALGSYEGDHEAVYAHIDQNLDSHLEHLQRWLAGVPARKSLVLIDTCESGSFSQSLVAMRGMAEKTAIAKLTRATGRATIVASTDEQPAAEGYRGHGVFTYVLLQALHHADVEFGNRDGYTGLFELAAYVNDQVPSITMNAFKFEQIPQVHMVGTDFPIGVVKPVDS